MYESVCVFEICVREAKRERKFERISSFKYKKKKTEKKIVRTFEKLDEIVTICWELGLEITEKPKILYNIS